MLYRFFNKKLKNRRVRIGYTLERPDAPIAVCYKNLIIDENGKAIIDTTKFALSEEAAIATYNMLGAALAEYRNSQKEGY